MSIGIRANCFCVTLGGVIGVLFGQKLPKKLKTDLTQIFALYAIGMGIYGSLNSEISGDLTILISKSMPDFFTSLIFACSLGAVVSFVAVPQLLIFLVIFSLSKIIYPQTTSNLIADFQACGGFLLIATGFCIAGIKAFPTVEMIPAMVLVLPVSWLWTNCIMSLLS